MQQYRRTERAYMSKDEYVALIQKFDSREIIDGMTIETISADTLLGDVFDVTIEWVRINTANPVSSAVLT